MTNEEISKYITEKVFGGVYVEVFNQRQITLVCPACGSDPTESIRAKNTDYTANENFVTLFEKCRSMDWFDEFARKKHIGGYFSGGEVLTIYPSAINPIRFATAIVEFLKQKDAN